MGTVTSFRGKPCISFSDEETEWLAERLKFALIVGSNSNNSSPDIIQRKTLPNDPMECEEPEEKQIEADKNLQTSNAYQRAPPKSKSLPIEASNSPDDFNYEDPLIAQLLDTDWDVEQWPKHNLITSHSDKALFDIATKTGENVAFSPDFIDSQNSQGIKKCIVVYWNNPPDN
ncbi:UNVERIFIED_CONTAM: hypothetical protein Sradi_3896400 [Sesamum radiatum]|uniref:Uncharacterized protein n=1 Tax=Sesamum radiatum TaxID=300843 RepID=A0AAW2PDZ1_SESRA